ncbi:MAG TPA: response regulator, partial [Caulobacter sp.]|nr:response regulator [Caulobacter sp.]
GTGPADGGELIVNSVEGQGATFILTLTVEAVDAPQAGEDGPSITGAQVLVVDDHVVNRRAIELVLQPFGIEATLAESGEQALELLGAKIFDVVLMDVYMPGMDGREATRTLRAGAGLNRETPVIAVTASATPKDW